MPGWVTTLDPADGWPDFVSLQVTEGAYVMATGTVKWYNPAKRFGFIKPDDGSNDVFVHVSALEQAGLNGLDEGQRIQYEMAENKGKMSAVNLKIVA
jgi:cold shock protein